jgi:hypothetical protein
MRLWKKDKWKTFKKLGDAIRMAEKRGTRVRWDDEIDGQPFDVTLRLRLNTQDFLVVVDCLVSEGPVTTEEVETFAAKSRAVGARLPIMASSSGYTKEATDFATNNDIRLLALETIQGLPVELLADAFNLVLWTHTFRFIRADGSGEIGLPEEPELLSYFMREMKVEGPGVDSVPEQLVNEQYDEKARTVNTSPQLFTVTLPTGTTIKHPNTEQKTAVKAFTFVYQLISAADIKTKEGLGQDPYFLGSVLEVELVKRNPAADPSKIESGFDTTLEPRKYYYNPRFRFSYYCEAVKRSKATVVLVESYQAGRLVQARAELSTDLSGQFVEITEKTEIERLSKMYERFVVSDKNLEERFKVFAKNMEGTECIDALALTEEQREANKADYLFAGREVIAELKALKTDAFDKIEKILAPYRETPEWPLFFGAQDLQKILSHLPDREKINRKLVEAVTDSVERIVRKANQQIRDTKRTFNLPDAGGLLIILNDLVEIISPDLIAYRVRRSLSKRIEKGSDELCFPDVSAVVIIGGTHYAQVNPNVKGIPILIITSNVPEAKKVEEFISALIQKWSAFDGQPLVKMDGAQAMTTQFRKISDDAKREQGPITVQQYWEYEYRGRPYLRRLSKEDLLQYGRQLFEEMTPNFLKGVPKEPQEQVENQIMRFTHFLEEVRFRGVDMREFAAKLDGLKEKVDELIMRHSGSGRQRQSPTRAEHKKKQSKVHKNKIGRGAPCPCQSGKTYSRCCGAKESKGRNS